MKVLLINPPFGGDYSVGASPSIRYVLNVIQPLGLAYLAAAVERRGFEAGIIDCTAGVSPDELFKRVVRENPAVVGLSATTASFLYALRIAAKIKELLPAVVVVIGGAHITAMPEDILRSECLDIGVIGEGELIFPELLSHIRQKGLAGLERIKGIAYKDAAGEVVVTKREDFINDLDSLPYPARHLLPALSCYRPTPASYKRLPLATIMTSRGCPSQCVFCDRAVFGNGFRKRSAGNVLGEVEEVIAKYGAREIRFFDDLFTLDKGRVFAICGGLKKMKIPWTCLTTVRAVSRELLKEMKASGCWQVLYGLESADEGMLKRLRKGNNLEDNIRAVRWAKEAGLSVRADFIVGTPGETKESLKKTLRFALRMKLDYAHFNKFVPLPGTELYRRLVVEGYSFDFGPGSSITDHGNFLYIPQTIKDKEYYKKFVNYAHKRFYLRPGYILRRLFSLRSPAELLGQIKGLLSIALLPR